MLKFIHDLIITLSLHCETELCLRLCEIVILIALSKTFKYYHNYIGVILIWQKAVAPMQIIAMKLYWHYLNLANRQKITKPPNKLRIWYYVFLIFI